MNSSSSTFPIPVMISFPPNPGIEDVVDCKAVSDLDTLWVTVTMKFDEMIPDGTHMISMIGERTFFYL